MTSDGEFEVRDPPRNDALKRTLNYITPPEAARPAEQPKDHFRYNY